MNSREPHKTEPTGAPRPFDRQIETDSNGAHSLTSVVWLATTALKARAPSRCIERPASRANAATLST